MRYSQVRSNDQLDKNLFPNFPRINLSIALTVHTILERDHRFSILFKRENDIRGPELSRCPRLLARSGRTDRCQRRGEPHHPPRIGFVRHPQARSPMT